MKLNGKRGEEEQNLDQRAGRYADSVRSMT